MESIPPPSFFAYTAPPQADSELMKHVANTHGALDLSQQNLSYAQLILVANTLAKNPHITSLNLSGNIIDHQAAYFLADAIRRHPLTQLTLEQCRLIPGNFEALAQALIDHKQMTHLSFSDNALGAEAEGLFEPILVANPQLRELNLSNNGLSEDCVHTLLNIPLSSHPHLSLSVSTLPYSEELTSAQQTLELYHHVINASGTIDLRERGITSATMEGIRDALLLNPRITALDLRHNVINPTSLEKLFAGMVRCPVLTLRARLSISEEEYQAQVTSLKHKVLIPSPLKQTCINLYASHIIHKYAMSSVHPRIIAHYVLNLSTTPTPSHPGNGLKKNWFSLSNYTPSPRPKRQIRELIYEPSSLSDFTPADEIIAKSNRWK